MTVQKVAWAVDAFPDKADLQSRAGKAIQGFVQALGAKVEPVWVMRMDPEVMLIPETPQSRKSRMATADQNVKTLVKSIGGKGFLPTRFLHCDVPSVKATVRTLLRFADKDGCDLIAVATHARQGASRLFLGSFAETLILESPIPVLITNAKSPVVGKVKHILFATDFSDESREAYEQVLGIAKQIGADVLLFHQLENPYPIAAYPYLAPVIPQETLEEIRAARQKAGEAWVAAAAQQKVRAKLHLSTTQGDVAKKIVSAAAKLKSCVIAMASQSGPVSAVILGSLTRRVLRTASTPLLILHSHAVSKKARAPLRAFDDLPSRQAVLG